MTAHDLAVVQIAGGHRPPLQCRLVRCFCRVPWFHGLRSSHEVVGAVYDRLTNANLKTEIFIAPPN